MDYTVSQHFLHNKIHHTGRTIVGRLCKQIEVLQKNLDPDSKEYKALSCAKNFRREEVYQALRDLENQIKCYNEGRTFRKLKMYNPDSDKKE